MVEILFLMRGAEPELNELLEFIEFALYSVNSSIP
jgi:hypothetical protein